LIPEGLKATQRMVAEGIKVNVTHADTGAGRSKSRCLVCVSVRLDDMSSNGTFVLVASLRHPQYVVEGALVGGDICAVSVFKQLVKHPLTDVGMKKSLTDWNAQLHK
jgi:transaldolase